MALRAHVKPPTATMHGAFAVCSCAPGASEPLSVDQVAGTHPGTVSRACLHQKLTAARTCMPGLCRDVTGAERHTIAAGHATRALTV